MNYKSNSSKNDLPRKENSESKEEKHESIKTQSLIHEIHHLCDESNSAFFNNNYEMSKNSLINLCTLLSDNIESIHYEQIESSVLTVFTNIHFDLLIFQICEIIINNNQYEEMISIIINCIYFLTDLDLNFFENVNLIPFLNTIFINHQNTSQIQNEIIEIYSRILPNQIIYDPKFSNFSPIFFKILEKLTNYRLKAKLIESFINSSNEMNIYFQQLFPFLSFFFQKERCTEIEIRIISSLIQHENKIFPFLLQNGFIQHILASISKYKEEINIQIINFYLFILNFDATIRKAFNFDNICVNYFDSESEEEQTCALNYFCHFLPECLPFLFDKVDIDLLWSIISDSFFEDSKIELKVVSLRFLYNLLRFNNNNDMMFCILHSNICEICEIMLNLDDFESTCLCIDSLYILLDFAVKDPNYMQAFITQFKQSGIESILLNISDENIQAKASNFLLKIDQLCQNS